MEDINNVEGQVIEKEIIQDKAKLEEKIASLTARKEELGSKIAIARMSNKRNNLYNSLLVLYSSVCGLIVNCEAALFALVAGGAFAVAQAFSDEHRVMDTEDELFSVNETLTMYRR